VRRGEKKAGTEMRRERANSTTALWLEAFPKPSSSLKARGLRAAPSTLAVPELGQAHVSHRRRRQRNAWPGGNIT